MSTTEEHDRAVKAVNRDMGWSDDWSWRDVPRAVVLVIREIRRIWPEAH